jgi:peroxiredoxin
MAELLRSLVCGFNKLFGIMQRNGVLCLSKKGVAEMMGMWVVAFVLQWVLLLLLAVLLVGVLRYLGLVQKNIHLVTRYASRFEEGDRIGRFELTDLNDLPILSEALLSIKPKTLLFFLSTGCSGCTAMVKQIAELAKHEGGLGRFASSFVLIYTGSRTSVKAHVAPIPLGEVTVLIDEEGMLYRQYDIRQFPVAIAVNNHGRVIDQKLGNDISRWLSDILNVQPSTQWSHSLTGVVDSTSKCFHTEFAESPLQDISEA